MNALTRAFLVGAAVVLIGSCASTGSSGSESPMGNTPMVNGIPWSGTDAQFLQRAILVIDGAGESAPREPVRETDEARDAVASRMEIALGSTATLTELVLAVSFSDWDSGRTALIEADMLQERTATRLDRVVLRRYGSSVVGYLDVDSHRLPATLGLHWSGWERLGRGEWRDPRSRVEVRIPRNGGWTLSRGPEIDAPLGESISGESMRRLVGVGLGESDAVPVMVWVRGLAVAGIPSQVLPSRLALLAVSSGSQEDLMVRAVLPFRSERDARIALVASRLVIPRFLQEVALGRGPDFRIFREAEKIYIVDVALTREHLTDLLAMSVGFMRDGEDQ